METESGAKIAIRGKGSVKEGKGRSDAAHQSNLEEDLHCLIMAETEDKVNKAKQLIHNVVETAASIPEGQNELKRNQLRELAALNGTLRDDENQACQNCGRLPSSCVARLLLTIGQVGKLVIASMIVPTSVTSPTISSVVFVVMAVTWLAIVLIGPVVETCETIFPVVLKDESGVAMLSTENMRYALYTIPIVRASANAA